MALYCGDIPQFNIFIAVDFGTTYSGYCFAVGKNSTDYQVQPSARGAKVPTALLLTPEGDLRSFGQQALDEYCGLDDDEADRCYFFDRFKMVLKNDSAITADTVLTEAKGKKLAAKAVFARSLEYFARQAREEVSQHSMVTSWDEAEIKWVLTVPAMWGEGAKQFMTEAAIEAKMSSFSENIEIALEPESAAICCRHDLIMAWKALGRPNPLRYAVADCGGGTIDMVLHDLNVTTQKIREVARADGLDLGGTTVDKNIEWLIRDIIGEKAAEFMSADDWLLFSRLSIEKAKRSITTTSQKVPVDLLPSIVSALHNTGVDLEDRVKQFPGVVFRRNKNALLLDVSLIKECFLPPVDQIVSKLFDMISICQGVHILLVVGGFSDSPFLLSRLQREFSSPARRIIHPSEPSNAVVKGAVMFGQNPSIMEVRVSRYTYGVKVYHPFDARQHPEEKKVCSNGSLKCKDVFSTFVQRDTPIEIGEPFEKQFFPRCKDQKSATFEVFRSTAKSVQFVDEPGCELLATVTVSLVRSGESRLKPVKAFMDFSQTVLRFTALYPDSGEKADVTIDFHCH